MARVIWSEAQKYIQMSRYSRWRDDLGRRESWDESVDRYIGFMKPRFEDKVPSSLFPKIEKAIKNLETMPSMRAAWAAGDALAENNILAYNCCYLPIIDIQCFVEIFYVLMCGTGVGTSVERQYISQLPAIVPYNAQGRGTHVVGDSREGWADSLRAGLEAWFAGEDIDFDYSQVRPKGARLIKMGGRASGPDPLKELHNYAR
jgi:ribonucleoside-triphosphate reductase